MNPYVKTMTGWKQVTPQIAARWLKSRVKLTGKNPAFFQPKIRGISVEELMEVPE